MLFEITIQILTKNCILTKIISVCKQNKLNIWWFINTEFSIDIKTSFVGNMLHKRCAKLSKNLLWSVTDVLANLISSATFETSNKYLS